jgi:hypothetical protein
MHTPKSRTRDGIEPTPVSVVDASRVPLARPLWILMTILATLLAVFSLHYLRPGMPDGFLEQLPVYREHSFWFLLHIIGGAVALATGPWQVWPGLRRSRPRLHRWMGRLYVAGVALGSFGGLYMGFLAFGGPTVQASFVIIALLWPLTTGLGVRHVLAGRVAVHRRWMLRSLALTLAAVTLRFWLAVLEPHLGIESAYQAAAWLCWVPNLLVVEWWLRRGRQSPDLAAAGPATA